MIENLENYEDAVPVKTVFEYTFDGEKPATRTETDLANNTKTNIITQYGLEITPY